MFLGQRIKSSKAERLGGGESKISYDLEKWNTFVFPYFMIRLNCSKREEI